MWAFMAESNQIVTSKDAGSRGDSLLWLCSHIFVHSYLCQLSRQRNLDLLAARGLVRLRAEAVLGPAGVAGDLRHRLERHRRQLALYREIEQRDFSGRELSRAERLQYLVLQSGLATEAQQAALCEQALELLSAPEPD